MAWTAIKCKQQTLVASRLADRVCFLHDPGHLYTPDECIHRREE